MKRDNMKKSSAVKNSRDSKVTNNSNNNSNSRNTNNSKNSSNSSNSKKNVVGFEDESFELDENDDHSFELR